MEDLLELNKLVSTIRTEIIPPQSNRTIKASTPLVLMGVCMNVMTDLYTGMTRLCIEGYMYDLAIVHITVVTRKQMFNCTTLKIIPLSYQKELL